MKDVLVSFCIATFQRYDIVKELILEILSVDSEEFEVVVCDNCSQDESVSKLRQIKDERLKIFVNDTNVGGLQNIYESLNRGTGKYLFYLNDRDNVDFFKIKRLLDVIKELDKEEIAFAQCVGYAGKPDKYRIYNSGEEAIVRFACRIVHPTGFIFRRENFERIKNGRSLFENKEYGDYQITMLCALMAKEYKGAEIYGNICDLARERIDFSKIKSGFFLKKTDIKVWYSKEVQWRELLIAYGFLKSIHVKEAMIEKILALRYEEYLRRVMIDYRSIVEKPSNTLHYNMQPPSNVLNLYMIALKNGLYLWMKMKGFCLNENKSELLREIKIVTGRVFKAFLLVMYRDVIKK